jgi:hypothetical protein
VISMPADEANALWIGSPWAFHRINRSVRIAERDVEKLIEQLLVPTQEAE